MDLQDLFSVIIAVLYHHQHAFLLNHLLDHCIDDFAHLV